METFLCANVESQTENRRDEKAESPIVGMIEGRTEVAIQLRAGRPQVTLCRLLCHELAFYSSAFLVRIDRYHLLLPASSVSIH